MSDSQTVWLILWNRAASGRTPREPFEISEVVPEIVDSLTVSEKDARRFVGSLLGELSRMPDGEQFFRLEGSAIVPLAEFASSPKDPKSALAAYPYEL